MKYLLDTQVFLWMQAQPHKFGVHTLGILRDDKHDLYLSAASAWEIALKVRKGQLSLPETPDDYVPERMRVCGVKSLPVEPSHALEVAIVDGRKRDLIDRLLIGQATVEDMPLISADPKMPNSAITVIDATR